MVDIQRIEWEEFPKPRQRGKPARPEFDAVRALKIGEAIKFPCTWNHFVKVGRTEVCFGKSRAQQSMRIKYPKRYIEALCVDRVIYVRRGDDKTWDKKEDL
jgi:hypothetical protein